MKAFIAPALLALVLSACSSSSVEKTTDSSNAINFGEIPANYADQAAKILRQKYKSATITINTPETCIMGQQNSAQEDAGWCFTSFTHDENTMNHGKALVSQFFIKGSNVELFKEIAGIADFQSTKPTNLTLRTTDDKVEFRPIGAKAQ